ncbi:hypothetical protein [Janibacter terrae]|uniref:hypothetical protein n=1 Tax=Janibacter terrae TaxID=103817 RepID=UPI0031F8533D
MTAAPQSADAFLLGGGGKSASFENIGDSITGTVVSTEVRQQTDLAGNPRTWDDGNPIMQLVVKLQTSHREDQDDDGIRAVYVKGSKKTGSRSLHDAVATAVRSSGAKSLEQGGTLTVTHDGTEPSATRGFSDRKLYTATYVAPDHAAQAGDFLGTAPAPVAAAAPVAQPVQQPAPAAVPAPVAQPTPAPAPAGTANPTPEQLAAFQQYMASQQQPGA